MKKLIIGLTIGFVLSLGVVAVANTTQTVLPPNHNWSWEKRVDKKKGIVCYAYTNYFNAVSVDCEKYK